MESIFETKEQFLQMRDHFRKWYNTDDNKTKLFDYHFAIYALLRGKDWRKCFSPNTKESTIQYLHFYLKKSKMLNLECFGENITIDSIQKLRDLGIPEWE